MRVRRQPEIPEGCPWTASQIREINRQHDRKFAEVPEWIVFAPPFLDKNEIDEETDNQLARYHQQINAQQSSHRLIQSLEDQAKLEKLAPKRLETDSPPSNDQLDRQTNPRTIRLATRQIEDLPLGSAIQYVGSGDDQRTFERSNGWGK